VSLGGTREMGGTGGGTNFQKRTESSIISQRSVSRWVSYLGRKNGRLVQQEAQRWKKKRSLGGQKQIGYVGGK